MEGLALLIPGLLTGFAALIAAIAALFKRENSKIQQQTEVSHDTVDVIEKILDGQTHINEMFLQQIKSQDEKMLKQDELIQAQSAIIADLQKQVAGGNDTSA